MQPRKRTENHPYNDLGIPTEFSDGNFQQAPLKLPKLSGNISAKQSSHLKNRNKGVQLPKIKESRAHEMDSLDGSEDLNQSQNYANSSDNMRDQINDIRKKMNISKYSENFIQSEQAEQYNKEKHSGSSTYIRNSKNNQREENSKKGSRDGLRKLMSEVNNEKNRTLVTEVNKADSDISDFEQKIQANRVIIKNNKFTKKNKEDKDKSTSKKLNLFDKKSNNQLQQGVYQKRVRQYKNLSENKYLKEKKKEIKEIAISDLKLKQKDQELKIKPRDLTKDINTPERSRRQSPSPNTSHQRIDPYQPPKVNTINRRKSKLKEQMLDESSPPVYPVGENLFADINLILGKKHKSRSQFLSVGKLSSLSVNPNAMPKKKISLNIKQLERSFRMLQQQQTKLLGTKRDPQNLKVSINKSLLEPSNILEWQRIAISDNRKELNLVESNFVNEVDRINSFHQKNEQSLETYIANRELLIQLQIQQRMKEMSPMKAKMELKSQGLQFQ